MGKLMEQFKFRHSYSHGWRLDRVSKFKFKLFLIMGIQKYRFCRIFSLKTAPNPGLEPVGFITLCLLRQ